MNNKGRTFSDESFLKRRWSSSELSELFTLTPVELDLLPDRQPHARLGFAVLFKYLQVRGFFPSAAEELPKPVLDFLADQVGVTPETLAEYSWAGRTIGRHRARIRNTLGYREATVEDTKEVARWLAEQFDGAGNLHVEEMAYGRLRELRIEPPSPDRVGRLVRSAMHLGEHRLRQKIFTKLAEETRVRFDDLIQIEALEDSVEAQDPPILSKIRKEAGPPTLESVFSEIAKLERIREIGLPEGLFEDIAPRAVRTYYRRAAVEKPLELRRHPDDVRYSLLASYCWARGREITDDLVDLLIQVIHRFGSRAENKVTKELLGYLIRVHGKSDILLRLAEAALAFPDGIIREVVYPEVDENILRNLVRELKAAGPAYEVQVRTRIKSSYSHHYRRMLPKILSALEFRSNNEKHKPVIEALALLKRYTDSRARFFRLEEQVPLDGVVPDAWRDAVIQQTKQGRQRIHRIGYEICVLQALRKRLRTKELWVVGADRYRNPDEDLPADFAKKREAYYSALDQPLDVDIFVTRLQDAMSEALRTLEKRLAEGLSGTVISAKGRIKVSPLKKQKEPQNISGLKREIRNRWPMTNLLDVFKEADLRVMFTEHLRGIGSQERLNPDTLRKRLLLCLYALGTNLGLNRVSAGDNDQTYDDILYVRRRFLHKEQLRNAISQVVNAIFALRQPEIWGEATTTCASDSKQFGAWDQNLMTEWHARYGGPGVMVYWHVERKATCIYSQLRRCSSSEVAAMIEGVLRHCTTMSVDKQYVDTHGQSHVGFAFCYLLGFQLLPRLKGIHKRKLSRPRAGEPDKYPGLQAILTKPINWDLIRQQYDEMMKFATALRLGTAESDAILRRFTRDNQHPTYRALSELGRAVITIFMCKYLGSPELRREIQEALNIIELWNSVIEFIFCGRGGDIPTNSRNDQEIVMLSLHLVQNCLIYVNTLMIQEVLSAPEWEDRLTPEDLRALTPLLFLHVNPYGRFYLDMNERLQLDPSP